jgi:membrane associated rhomboid family serine protease
MDSTVLVTSGACKSTHQVRSVSVIPLKDENPTSRRAVLTLVIIAACIAIYFFVQPSGQGSLLAPDQNPQRVQEEIEFNVEHAAIPCEVVEGRPLTIDELRRTFNFGDETSCDDRAFGRAFAPDKNVYLAVLYSMFLHGGLLHLAGNMLFLWIFGNNIEDRMRPLGYAAFYLLGGLAAMIAHTFVQPDSTVPVVGASGAIAAVMGAYLVLFPNAPIRTIFIFYFIFFRNIAAKWLLGFWLLSQFFINPNEGVAWVAHVGGFAFGVVVALLFRQRLRPSHAVWRY